VLSVAARLVEPAKILIIVGISYTLAVSGWYFFSAPAPNDALAAAPTSARSDAPPPDIHRITSRHLFGRAGAEPVDTPVVYNAPETRLQLTLEGLFEADDPKRSAAIVAERNQAGELYLVGDRLPGDALLAEVHHDRIVLRRGAVYETLRFSDQPGLARAGASEIPLPAYDEPAPYDEPGYAEELMPVEEPQAEFIDEQARVGQPVRSGQAALRETVQHYRERLDQDPEGTLSELGVAPVADDRPAGYRLGALAEHPAVRQAGLQSGDVVLSVNGNPIGSIEQDRQQLESLISQGSVRLEIQRGSRRMFITTSLQ
jgi:general secretion pathway protein C